MSISVVVPAFNEEDMLGRCLESLLRQVLPVDEIIVVDNNSTDNTARVALSYGATVVREQRQGVMPATYTGFALATSDIIARCDADSIVPLDWTARIDEAMNKQPEASGITGPGVFYDTNSIVAKFAQVWYMYAYFLLVGSALANWPLFGSNCALRRSVWQGIKDNLHRQDSAVHDDMEISIHIPSDHSIIFKPSLKVGISARSLKMSGMVRRYQLGFRTLLIHWPEQAPWRRWRTR